MTKHDNNSDLPHIEYENINSGMGSLKNRISELHTEKDGVVFQKNDILFGKLRPYLKNWYFANFDGIAVGDFWILRSDNIYPKFVYYLIQTEKFFSISNLSSGSKMPRSDWNLVSNYKFQFPQKIQESMNIGQLLSVLDKLLSLQQRKLEQLKQLKKAMLQKISNHKLMVDDKEYENMKVKVADIYTVTRGNVLAKGKISPQKSNKYLYPVYSSQTKNDGLMGYYEKYLFENAITWTTDGANAGTVKYREGKFYSTNVNGVLLSNKGYANKLAASLLNQVAFKYVSHVGNPKLMNNVMKEITFQIPKNVKVQIKLSKYLALLEKSIDNQLVIENEYKKLRKFLLQKLFI
ncbi:restriction endonuclease subunit S [uncultured Lactobacillus sp.]|uniref:restriction endonuclease subunit S n=1 Tax=uncultured Lactobacillus sp. TaxID=153152 RepID=UPI00280394D4|nr:restriction endonuclease subunit S [uncultured Lactobacillus sp.]